MKTCFNEITEFKDLHCGKNAFILASGPSLAELDLSPLSRRIVIGLNRSCLIWPQTHYHCVMDERLFQMYQRELEQTRYLFTFEGRPFGIPIKLLGAEDFSFDLEQGIYSGYTVAYFALQLAVYMGFRNIFFVGLDLRLHNGQTHFFGVDSVSKNHENTEFPKMQKMFRYAASRLAPTEVKVYNCSPISTLDCFERVTFDWAIQR